MKKFLFKDSGFYFDSSLFSKKERFGGHCPVILDRDKNKLEIALGVYEERNRTYISRITMEINIHKNKPHFSLLKQTIDEEFIKRGGVGSYSEYGIIPSSCIKLNNKIALFTIGFDSRNKSIFHVSSGLVYLYSKLKLIKHLPGPVLDRTPQDSCFSSSPCVFKKNKSLKILYTSSSKFGQIDNDKYHHYYTIKMRESKSEFNIPNNSIELIGPKNSNEYAIARPALIYIEKKYYLFYCKRKTKISDDYMIFCRESDELKEFPKKEDYFIDIEGINDKNFIDCQCYPYIFKYGRFLIMFFNGKFYGRSGFRIAYCELKNFGN